MSNSVIGGLKLAGDTTAAVTAFGTLLALLPPLAALFTIVWTGLRIIEMFTGKTIHRLIVDVRKK